MRIFLIRHGQSVQNTGENSVLGLADHKVILTEHGKIQARNAAEVLNKYIHQNNIKWRKAKVWYSPFDRTKETMEVFDEVLNFQSSNIHISEDIHLTEQQFGLFDGIPKEKWEVFFLSKLVFIIKSCRNRGSSGRKSQWVKARLMWQSV